MENSSEYQKKYYKEHREELLEKHNKRHKEKLEEDPQYYAKQYERRMANKKMYTVRIDNELAEKLDKKLDEEGKAFTDLVKDAINKYLKNI